MINTQLVCFSPTMTTKRILNTMFAEQSDTITDICDLTDSRFSGAALSFGLADLIVFGIPVYSGRVPKTAIDRFRNLNGLDTPTALVATYGNRDYDDALLELGDLLTDRGFRVIAGAAVVTQHSIVEKIATGRPNQTDQKVLREFGYSIVKKLKTNQTSIRLPGNQPYREYETLSLQPKGNRTCVACGQCVKHCPTQAISSSKPRYTDKALCISCMRCVKFCPVKARSISKIKQYAANKVLTKKCQVEKQNQLFI